jgi:hypothetical protein
VIARPPRHRGEGGGLAVLVVVTVLAALAAPHAKALRGLVPGGLPAIAAPELPGDGPPTAGPSPRAARAVAFALAQRASPTAGRPRARARSTAQG